MSDDITEKGTIQTPTHTSLTASLTITILDQGLKPDTVRIDPEAYAILLTPSQKSQQKETQTQSPLTDLETQDAFRQMESSFQRHGLISKEMNSNVAKLIEPTDIHAKENGLTRFFYPRDDAFPSGNDKRGEISITPRSYNLQMERVSRALEGSGIKLTTDQIRKLTLRQIVAHEYGHAVERTMQILRFNINSPGTAGYNLAMQVFQSIAPNEDLNKFFEGTKDAPQSTTYDPSLTTSERIATGFEIAGLKYALEDMNLTTKQVELFTSQYKTQFTKTMEEYQDVFEKIKRAGFASLKAFAQKVEFVTNELNLNGKNPEADRLFTWQFGARTIGYAFPLSEEEIKKLVNLKI